MNFLGPWPPSFKHPLEYEINDYLMGHITYKELHDAVSKKRNIMTDELRSTWDIYTDLMSHLPVDLQDYITRDFVMVLLRNNHDAGIMLKSLSIMWEHKQANHTLEVLADIQNKATAITTLHEQTIKNTEKVNESFKDMNSQLADSVSKVAAGMKKAGMELEASTAKRDDEAFPVPSTSTGAPSGTGTYSPRKDIIYSRIIKRSPRKDK